MISQAWVIDAGVGNPQSVMNMCKKIGIGVRLEASPPSKFCPGKDIFILPGVGAFDNGASSLVETGWSSFLMDAASADVAILGLCLGMQLLCDGSEEGDEPGLGLIPGYFARIPSVDVLVPHMGWNDVFFDTVKASWAPQEPEPPRYYFVHSFHYQHTNDDHIVGTVNYGKTLVAAVQRGNTIGLQFHPEKSHRFGQDLLTRIFETLC